MSGSFLQLDLLAVPEAVPELRRTVRAWLEVPCADVQVCVTELLTNVIRHVGGGTPVRVRVVQAEGRIRVEVSDPDPRTLPVLLSATEAEESGRGLALLDALVQRWGVELGPAGKTVWCELADVSGRRRPGGVALLTSDEDDMKKPCGPGSGRRVVMAWSEHGLS